MRSRSLIKKIGAVLLATTIFASIGLTGFAAEIVDGSTTADLADRVSADVSVTDVRGGYGFYNVAIDYTNNTTLSTVGITMLAYAETANEQADGLTADQIPAGYSEELQIVGINQTEVATSGTFNFLVDTNPDTVSSGVLRMDRGDSGIVLLSADGAVAPTGYLFTIPAAESFVVDTATTDVTEVEVPYGTAIETVIAQLEQVPYTVSGEGYTENNWNANEWSVTDYNAKTPGTYDATGKLAVPDGAAATIVDGGIEVSMTVRVLEPEASWIVADARAIVDPSGKVFEAISVTVADATDTDEILAAIKKVLLDAEQVGGITIYSHTEDADVPEGEGPYGARVIINEAIAESLTATETEGTYQVTIPTDAEVVAVVGEEVIISNPIDFTFAVTVEEDPTLEPDEPTETFVAASAEAVDGNGTPVTSIEVENGTEIDAAIALLPTKAILYNEDKSESKEWKITGWTIDGYDGATAADYEAVATLEAPADETVDISAVTIKVTVTVGEDESGGEVSGVIRGDIDGNEVLEITDLGKFYSYWANKFPLDITDPNVKYRCDIDGNGTVEITDLGKFVSYWANKFTMPD